MRGCGWPRLRGHGRICVRPAMLPTVVPRLVTLCLAGAFGVLAVAAIRFAGIRGVWRTGRAATAIAIPEMVGERRLSVECRTGSSACSIVPLASVSGPTTAKEPTVPDLSRRYAELLFENLGQPGFRELILTAVDLETRTDLVFAAIGEPRRAAFFRRGVAISSIWPVSDEVRCSTFWPRP